MRFEMCLEWVWQSISYGRGSQVVRRGNLGDASMCFNSSYRLEQSCAADTSAKVDLWDDGRMNQEKSMESGRNIRAVYNITGVSGEYFAAAELSRRGWIAVLT